MTLFNVWKSDDEIFRTIIEGGTIIYKIKEKMNENKSIKVIEATRFY